MPRRGSAGSAPTAGGKSHPNYPSIMFHSAPNRLGTKGDLNTYHQLEFESCWTAEVLKYPAKPSALWEGIVVTFGMELLHDAAEVPPCPTRRLPLSAVVLQAAVHVAVCVVAHHPRHGSASWMSTSTLCTDLPCFADLFDNATVCYSAAPRENCRPLAADPLFNGALPTCSPHQRRPSPPNKKQKPTTKHQKQAT